MAPQKRPRNEPIENSEWQTAKKMMRKEATVDPAQSLPANEPDKGTWVGRRLRKQLAGVERRTSSSGLGSEDDGTSSSEPGSEDDGSRVCGGGWRLPNDLSSLATLLNDRAQQPVGWELLLGGLTSMLILKKITFSQIVY
jgi:hypothetical protein